MDNPPCITSICKKKTRSTDTFGRTVIELTEFTASGPHVACHKTIVM